MTMHEMGINVEPTGGGEAPGALKSVHKLPILIIDSQIVGVLGFWGFGV